jgi:hypothetical protein
MILFLLLGGWLLLAASADDQQFSVFGYLPEYRLRGFDYEGAFASGLTHLIYFSLEVSKKTGLPSALDRLPTANDAARARIAADKHDGKIMISFGGNARSEGIGSVSARARASARASSLAILSYYLSIVSANSVLVIGLELGLVVWPFSLTISPITDNLSIASASSAIHHSLSYYLSFTLFLAVLVSDSPVLGLGLVVWPFSLTMSPSLSY